MKFSRAFNKRVDLWAITSYPDGYGGDIVREIYGLSVWANVKTLSLNNGYRTTDLGRIHATGGLIFTFRYRHDFEYSLDKMFIVYRDKRYTINTYSVNYGLKDTTVSLIAYPEKSYKKLSEKMSFDRDDVEFSSTLITFDTTIKRPV